AIYGAVLDIALFDYRDRCTRGQVSGRELRAYVVDGVEILRAYKVIATAGVIGGRRLIRGRWIDDVPTIGFLVVGPLTGLGVVHVRSDLGESLDPGYNRR